MTNTKTFFRFTTSKGEEVRVTTNKSKNVTISFKGRTIDIKRPWLDISVLNYKSLTLPGTKKGQWSTGIMESTNNGSFPLLPTTFVIAKDITITATEFSNEAKDAFDKFNSSTRGKV